MYIFIIMDPDSNRGSYKTLSRAMEDLERLTAHSTGAKSIELNWKFELNSKKFKAKTYGAGEISASLRFMGMTRMIARIQLLKLDD